MGRGQPGGSQSGGAGDHRAPAGGGIGGAQCFEHGKNFGRAGFGTAQIARYRHAEQPGGGHFGSQIGGQAPRGLDFGSAGGDGGGEVTRGGEEGVHIPLP